MSAGAVIAVLAVVGALVAAYIYRCDVDFLKFLCDNKPSAKMQAISDRIKRQSDFSHPETAKKVNTQLTHMAKNNVPAKGQTQSEWCKRYGVGCPPKAKAGVTNSMFTTTRIAI